MANNFDWRGQTVGNHSQQHNGNVNGNIYYNYGQHLNKPKPPGNGSYELGLIDAAQKGSFKRIERYLSFDVQINFTDDEGRTALHWAVEKGHENIARALVEARCDIDPESEEHGTPLSLAVRGRKPSMARYLLEQGAHPDAASGKAGSALHAACFSNNLEMAILLLETGADVDIFRAMHVSISSDTPYHYHYLGTPLSTATRWGRLDLVTTLLSAGADVNSLSAGSIEPFPEDRKKWSKLPSDFEKADWVRSPIHNAASWGHDEVLKSLIESGAIVDAKCGHSPHSTAVNLAARSGHTKCMEILLAHGASISICDSRGNSPLQIAAWNGRLECLQLLLDNDAPVDSAGNGGDSPLGFAAHEGHKHCGELLIRRGADVAHKNNAGHTALHYAVDGDMVRLLVSHGAQMTARNHLGDTPLLNAAYWGRQSAVEALLDLGTPIHDVDNDKRNAYDQAKETGHVKLAEFLKQRGIKPTPFYRRIGR